MTEATTPTATVPPVSFFPAGERPARYAVEPQGESSAGTGVGAFNLSVSSALTYWPEDALVNVYFVRDIFLTAKNKRCAKPWKAGRNGQRQAGRGSGLDLQERPVA